MQRFNFSGRSFGFSCIATFVSKTVFSFRKKTSVLRQVLRLKISPFFIFVALPPKGLKTMVFKTQIS